MTSKQRAITILAILVTLLPLTGLPIVWKSAVTIVFGLLIIGVAISDWVMETWRDQEGSFSLPKSVKVDSKPAPEEKLKLEASVVIPKVQPSPTPTPAPTPTVSPETLESTNTTIPTVPVYAWPTETAKEDKTQVNSG